MISRESFRDELRQWLTFSVFALPIVLGFAFYWAAGDWDKAIHELLDATSSARRELPEYAESLTAGEREEQRYFVELVRDTNPVLLAALVIAFVALLAILFLLTMIVLLLYMFFGLYLVHRNLPIGARSSV